MIFERLAEPRQWHPLLESELRSGLRTFLCLGQGSFQGMALLTLQDQLTTFSQELTQVLSTSMFIAARFIVAKRPSAKCPSANE